MAPHILLSPPQSSLPSPGRLTRLVTFHLFSPRRPGHHSPLLPALLASPSLKAAASRFAWPWPPASLLQASHVAFTPGGRRGARGQRTPHPPRAAHPARRGPPRPAAPAHRSPPAARRLLLLASTRQPRPGSAAPGVWLGAGSGSGVCARVAWAGWAEPNGRKGPEPVQPLVKGFTACDCGP